MTHHATLTGKHAPHTLRVDRGRLLIDTANVTACEVRVNGNSRLFGHLALLKLHPINATKYPVNATRKTYTVVLIATSLACNVDAEAFRRLRVWLRFARAQHQDSTISPL